MLYLVEESSLIQTAAACECVALLSRCSVQFFYNFFLTLQDRAVLVVLKAKQISLFSNSFKLKLKHAFCLHNNALALLIGHLKLVAFSLNFIKISQSLVSLLLNLSLQLISLSNQLSLLDFSSPELIDSFFVNF